MAPWEHLPEDLRQSNIAEAADIVTMLQAISAVVLPEPAAAPEFAFTDEEVESLAQMEHERWMRDRLAKGWKYGVLRDGERKVHPELQPWPDLPEEARDRYRNAIRSLPATLQDAGFQIFRVPVS
jgi:hypothetical protein